MSDIAAQIFTSLYNELPDGRCTVRYKERTVISQAWTSGLEVSRVNEDNGQVDTLTGAVRYLTSSETAAGITIEVGDKVEIKQDFDADYQDARVVDRFQKAGAVRLSLGAEYE